MKLSQPLTEVQKQYASDIYEISRAWLASHLPRRTLWRFGGLVGCVSLIAMDITNAARSYNPDKGALSTWTCRHCIKWFWRRVYAHDQANKRNGVNITDIEIGDDEGKQRVEVLARVPGVDARDVERVIDYARKHILSDREIQMLDCYLQTNHVGYAHATPTVSVTLGVSNTAANLHLYSVFLKISDYVHGREIRDPRKLARERAAKKKTLQPSRVA